MDRDEVEVHKHAKKKNLAISIELHRDFEKVLITDYTLFLYKNVFFPAQAEYSYFSADFRLKIFLYYS